MSSYWTKQVRDKFLTEVKKFFLDDPYLFKYCANQIIRKCVRESEQINVIYFCHDHARGGHFSEKKTRAKNLQCGFYWPSTFLDTYVYCSSRKICQKLWSISRRKCLLTLF